MINTFCPFLKEKCKGNECVMWKNEECVLVSFLEHVQEGVPLSEEGMPTLEEGIERSPIILHREEAEVPDWIKKRTPEELAVEMLEFMNKEFPEDEGFSFHTASRYFWENKGVQEFLMPSEARLKIQRAEFLAQREIKRKAEAERKRKLKEEKDEIPSLVGQCVDWAKDNSLKKVTLADVDSFLFEKDLELMPETKRILYAMANVKLKASK